MRRARLGRGAVNLSAAGQRRNPNASAPAASAPSTSPATPSTLNTNSATAGLATNSTAFCMLFITSKTMFYKLPAARSGKKFNVGNFEQISRGNLTPKIFVKISEEIRKKFKQIEMVMQQKSISPTLKNYLHHHKTWLLRFRNEN